MTENSEGSDEAGSGSLVIPAIAGAAGAVVGYQLGGPGGAMIGGYSVPYLTRWFQMSARELLGDQAGRAEEMLGVAGEASGLGSDEFAERTSHSLRARFLTDAAIRAAADTLWPVGVRALGRALADGLIQADAAVVDIPKMVLPAMCEMCAPHVRLLDLLVMCRWDRLVTERGALRVDPTDNEHSEWTVLEMKAALPSLEPVLGSVLATLERYGLIEQNDSTAEALAKFSEALRTESDRNNPAASMGLGNIRQYSPVIDSTLAQQIAPEPNWSPTALGEQVLGYYDLAADAPH
jgi:hypothetical protein